MRCFFRTRAIILADRQGLLRALPGATRKNLKMVCNYNGRYNFCALTEGSCKYTIGGAGMNKMPSDYAGTVVID